MKQNFKISLIHNGIHSFNKGLELFIKYEKSELKDIFDLKESIMFLHHGIELLLKQILINKGGEYLIFDNINSETIKKIIRAKEENISVFELDKPINTTTYLNSIQRIKAFVDFPKISASLEQKLNDLNTLRNNLEHYGINTKRSKVENLLLELKEPIRNFFKDSGLKLGDENDKKWDELYKLLVEIFKLRNGGAVKNFDFNEKTNSLLVEYAENYNEYKIIQPQSNLTETDLNLYWETGNSIIKACNDGGVRLLSKFDNLIEVTIIVSHKQKKHITQVKREEIELFLNAKFDKIKKNWDDVFSNKYVYDYNGSLLFFEKFGKIINE